jgi:hypothetical protein
MREGPRHQRLLPHIFRLSAARLVWTLLATLIALFAIATPAHAAGPDVPEGFSLIVTDTISATGYYDATVRTAYVRSTASDWTQMHERCHAHQHMTILRETGQEPVWTVWQLESWYLTTEGAAYMEAITRSAYRWPSAWLSADNPLEDFANACGLYFVNPGWLYSLDPIRYEAVDAIFGAYG